MMMMIVSFKESSKIKNQVKQRKVKMMTHNNNNNKKVKIN